MYNRDMNAWLGGFLALGNETQWDGITQRCIKAHLELVKEVCENHLTVVNSYLSRNILNMTFKNLQDIVTPLEVYSFHECLYFLQGFFEISRSKEKLTKDQMSKVCDVLCSNEEGLNPPLQKLYFLLESSEEYDTEELQANLNSLFAHEVDPSYSGYEEHNEKWLEIHNSYKLEMPKMERQTAITLDDLPPVPKV